MDLQLLHHSKVATRSFHVKSLAKNLITLDLTEMTGQLEHAYTEHEQQVDELVNAKKKKSRKSMVCDILNCPS